MKIINIIKMTFRNIQEDPPISAFMVVQTK